MAIVLYDLAAAEDDRRFSPYCWRTKMALAHKGLEYQAVPWRFTEKDVIAFSGSTTVPVIRDGDTVVADSWRIALYLDEAYPQRPALFGGPEAQALCEFFASWAFRTVHPAVLKVVLPDLFARIHEKDKAYFRESREKRFGATLEAHAAEPKQKLADLRGALEPVRPVLVQNAFVSGKGPGLRRLHPARRVPVGARHVADPAARARRPGVRVARAHARPVGRPRAKGEGLPGLGLGTELSSLLALLRLGQHVDLLVDAAQRVHRAVAAGGQLALRVDARRAGGERAAQRFRLLAPALQ